MPTSDKELFSLTIPGIGEPLSLVQGKPLFILGRNGTGKSALVHRIRVQIGGSAVYLPGSRPSYFETEGLSLNPATRKQLGVNSQSWDSSPDTRWRLIEGPKRNEKAILDLQNSEIQFKVSAADDIKAHGVNSQAISKLQNSASPFDRINLILSQAGFPIRVVIHEAELTAERDGNCYSIARMSDGERNAIVLGAEVLTSPPNCVFIVDEPELHLHRGIIVPFLQALIQERPDAAFVISTHELELAASHKDPSIVVVHGCTWNGQSVASWDVSILSNGSAIPEDLRVDLLGARQKVLFVEGDATSMDEPLYSLLFPSASVRFRQNSREVNRAVIGLRGVQEHHHIDVYGLVDSDRMQSNEIEKLAGQGVFALPVYSVESLYYCEDVLKAMAAQQATTLGLSAEDLLQSGIERGLASLAAETVCQNLASRACEKLLRSHFLELLPSRNQIPSAGAVINLSLGNPFSHELERLIAFRDGMLLHEIIAHYPVRHSNVLSEIAKSLHFQNRDDYERAVRRRIERDDALAIKVRDKLGRLSSCLQ